MQNQYAMGTGLARHQAHTDIQAKARAYSAIGEAVDGMDVLAVEAATHRAVEAIRAGTGPVLLEARTYRFRAHSMYDPELYRDKAEVEQWKKRCPIEGFASKLRSAGLLGQIDLQELETSVAGQVSQAVAAAEAGPWEPVADLLKDVHSPADSAPPSISGLATNGSSIDQPLKGELVTP